MKFSTCPICRHTCEPRSTRIPCVTANGFLRDRKRPFWCRASLSLSPPHSHCCSVEESEREISLATSGQCFEFDRRVGHLSIENVAVQVSSVRPANHAKLTVDGYSPELGVVLERGEHAFKSDKFRQIDDPLDTVFEADMHTVGFQWS